MVNQRVDRSQRLAWLEGIRILAVVMLLLYHAQSRFTEYAYTPQPTGLLTNLRQLVVALENLPTSRVWPHILSLPAWFGFQFIDVFVLISGFSLVLSLKGKPLSVGAFLKRRISRVLWPFWTVAWLSYPVLWAIAIASNTQFPSAWHLFAGVSYPLVYNYDGELLLSSSGTWWLLSLLISFTVLFPFLWFLQQRWGAANLLIASVLLTVSYRFLSVFLFGGHPTYVLWDSPADWQPFALFLAKLSTFVVGMVVGRAYLKGEGPVFWTLQRSLTVGISLYLVGFTCQFYTWGWVIADLIVPLGLVLCWMVVFRILESWQWMTTLLLSAGVHSYSYFLLHGLVVDRTIDVFVKADPNRYALALPLMVVGTGVLAMLVDYARPVVRRVVVGLIGDIDHVLSTTETLPRRLWDPRVGDEVRYQGETGWTVLKVEKLWDEQEFFLCQVSDGQRSLWVNEDDLEPAGKRFR